MKQSNVHAGWVGSLASGIAVCLSAASASGADLPPPLPPLQIKELAPGVHFGIFGDKPAKPAPTLFIFAVGLEDYEKNRYFCETGQRLAAEGWISVAVDIPCHGKDAMAEPGEPAGIPGWAHRVKAGKDLMGPFTKRCTQILDHLIAEKYTDADRVAACGTSRGGFCAMHFAAADPRVRAVTGVSPVTNPLAVKEFDGITEDQVRTIQVTALADKLADRAVGLTIGNDDARVSTDDCIAATRAFTAAARKKTPLPASVPIELIVGPSSGHAAIENAYNLAADFIRKHCPAK